MHVERSQRSTGWTGRNCLHADTDSPLAAAAGAAVPSSLAHLVVRQAPYDAAEGHQALVDVANLHSMELLVTQHCQVGCLRHDIATTYGRRTLLATQAHSYLLDPEFL
jgi:hypothetical protein